MLHDPILDAIVQDLKNKYFCHTIILYGSRARGDATSTSDYDVMGFRDSADSYRDARFWNGVYLDIFIYPESKLLNPDEASLHVREGVILCQKNDLATRFLSQLKKIDQAGPKALAVDELQARKVWAQKMLDRAKLGDVEGNFRRSWLLTALLEDYFHFRKLWYRGSKQSFEWLKVHQPDVFVAFEVALKPGAPLSAIEDLVRLVIDKKPAEI